MEKKWNGFEKRPQARRAIDMPPGGMSRLGKMGTAPYFSGKNRELSLIFSAVTKDEALAQRPAFFRSRHAFRPYFLSL
jgi:hypothetical protein